MSDIQGSAEDREAALCTPFTFRRHAGVRVHIKIEFLSRGWYREGEAWLILLTQPNKRIKVLEVVQKDFVGFSCHLGRYVKHYRLGRSTDEKHLAQETFVRSSLFLCGQVIS